jgi:TRAP-type uncharacterized transport system substrate-binding protein
VVAALFTGMAVLTGVVALGACSAEQPAASGRLVISTGTTGGVYHAWGTSLAEQLRVTAPALEVRVETSVGSVSNLRRISLGVADLALTTMDATVTLTTPAGAAPATPPSLASSNRASSTGGAAPATPPSDECRLRTVGGTTTREVPLRALARVYDDYVQVVVRAGSSYRSVADLAGRPVAVGSTGSGTALVACRLLTAAGVSVDEHPVNVGPGMTALLAGEVDAVIWSGGLPTRAIASAAGTAPVRLLPLGSLADTLRTRYGGVYRPATVPSGYYGGAEQVTTLASPNLLVVRADADPAMVRAVLGAVFGRRDEIAASVPAADTTDRRTAVFTGSLPLHPAAVEYYRQTK